MKWFLLVWVIFYGTLATVAWILAIIGYIHHGFTDHVLALVGIGLAAQAMENVCNLELKRR
jgi:hypothetical protein